MKEAAAGSAYFVTKRTMPDDVQLYLKQKSYELYLSPAQQEFIVGIGTHHADPLHLPRQGIENIIEDLSQAQQSLFRPQLAEENHFSPDDGQLYDQTPGWNVYVVGGKVVIQQKGNSPGLLHLSKDDLVKMMARLSNGQERSSSFTIT